MSAQRVPYQPGDFLAVRDMLSEEYAHYGREISWRIERWNYARHFVAPMLAHYGLSAQRATAAEPSQAHRRPAARSATALGRCAGYSVPFWDHSSMSPPAPPARARGRPFPFPVPNVAVRSASTPAARPGRTTAFGIETKGACAWLPGIRGTDARRTGRRDTSPAAPLPGHCRPCERSSRRCPGHFRLPIAPERYRRSCP